MNFEDAVEDLKSLGLNIFLSIKVSALPVDLYPFTESQKNKTLCLVAHGGKTLWANLPHPLDLNTHPVDQFSLKAMQKFAADVLDNDIEILFPDDKFFIPLQKISRHLNFSHQSPMGLDICREFGLWFAYRGIFLTNVEIPITLNDQESSPCEKCIEQFCMLESKVSAGRLKCPVKSEHQYTPEQQLYHQSALKIAAPSQK